MQHPRRISSHRTRGERNRKLKRIMNTVFSHIVQKRLSQENENVATDALSFILNSSGRAHSGMMKVIRGIAPEMPNLQFRTQQTDGNARPDMWGLDGITPRVLIENKFWAGLTENQPVEYLRMLASKSFSPAILLAVVPEARLVTVWREFMNRLRGACLTSTPRDSSAGVARAESIDFGPSLSVAPILAVTSWSNLLLAIDAELNEDPRSRNDLFQLRALCDAANDYAPFSAPELTNQRTPALLLQLNTVVQRAVERGVDDGALNIKGLNATHFWEAHGRYLRFPTGRAVTAWLGTHFKLWHTHGSTPLWLYFSPKDGRGSEVRTVLEPWAEKLGIVYSVEGNGGFALGIDVVAGEEPDQVVRFIVDRLREVASQLSRLPDRADLQPVIQEL